jgi:hypothetical protein
MCVYLVTCEPKDLPKAFRALLRLQGWDVNDCTCYKIDYPGIDE